MTKFVLFAACLNIVLVEGRTTVRGDEHASDRKSTAESKDGDSAVDGPNNKSNSSRLTDEQTENALKFAETHHPELASLLKGLRSKSSTEFKRGIREVHLATIRLDRLQDKQPARFDNELKQWKIDSEIRLLSAKWIITGDKKLERKIQSMLRHRQENRLKRLETERDRLAARLQQLDQQINMDASGLEAALDAEWEKLAKRAAATRKSRRQSAAKKVNEGQTSRAGEK